MYYFIDDPTVDFETLELAMDAVPDCISYTQEDIVIIDDMGEIVAVRKWWDTPASAEDYEPDELADVISFGTFGHYAPWVLY